MKLKKILILVTVSLFPFFSTAFGGDRAVNGLILGGGSGALIGQSIGHNSESTIIGATVGGVLGYIIGNNTHSSVHGSYNHITTYSDNRYRHRQHRPRIIKEKYRDHHRNGQTCRKTTTIIREHGIRKRIISTECWGNDRHMRPTRHKFSHRNNHYGYRNRGHHRNHYRF